MIKDHIASQIYANFSFEPTFGQKKIIEKLSAYISEPDTESVFVLNGYAGTGKTTIIAALVKALKSLKIKPIVLAPTGRAAKVATSYTTETALTIHKKIYRQKSGASADAQFSLNVNREKDACFIVDEASMLSNHSGDSSIFGSGCLLDDLMSYVKQGVRCRLVLVGDDAQLPPVGEESSPALDPRRMGVYADIHYASLDEVVRHGVDSGILFNATLVRKMLECRIYEAPRFDLTFPDVRSISASELMEEIESCYGRYGKDETIIITRSNKRANRFNDGIRRYVMQAEEELDSGDMLMVVKNNYHFTEREEECPMDFVANGDIARLRRIRRYEDRYGFRFAEATLVFEDYNGYELDCRMMLDTLHSESPSLTREQSSALFFAVDRDYAEIRSKAKRYKMVREDSWFNALQVKFSYAVTCHKAQGGQWKAVFIDRMLFGEEPVTRDLLRWLYTAVTRATERLYFVGFDERFFSQEQ